MVAIGRKVLGHLVMAQVRVGSGPNASPERRPAPAASLPRARETLA
jgi:hypothetical protein